MTDTSLEAQLTALKSPMSHDEMVAAASRRGWWYICEHWLRTMRSYIGSVFGVGIAQPVLYLLAMGIGLGVVVDQATDTQATLGMSYLHFIAPALLLSAGLSSAMEENTFSIMAGFKWRETYFGPQVTPITPTQIAQGHVLGCTIRYFLSLSIYLVILVLFGAAQGWAAVWLLPIGILTASAVGLLAMGYASQVTQDKGQFALINRFIVLPMTLFSGTFFPLETLPGFLHPLGWISPLWHGVSLSRAVVTPLEIPDWRAAIHVAYLLVLCAVGWFFARRHFNRRLVG